MSAGTDLALGLVESDHGRELAKKTAQGLVIHHRRAGGQSQHSALLELDAKSDRVQSALAYAKLHLRSPLSIAELAGVSCLSPRQFTRLFRAETGVSPARAVEAWNNNNAEHAIKAFARLRRIIRCAVARKSEWRILDRVGLTGNG
jgi:transcriptional regulator GlxA family with amidase domain